MPLTAVDYDTQSARPKTDHSSTSLAGFTLTQKGCPARVGTEEYIAKKYLEIHDAHLTHFLPLLLSVSHNDAMMGAVGLGPGQYRPMFLEQYLDTPIEQKLAAFTNQPFDRDSVVEIGNLAVSHQGFSTILFIVMAMALREAGYQWMAFTITTQVEKIIARLGFRPTYLIDADPRYLGQHGSDWGSYYQNQPKVMFGNLDSIAEIAGGKRRLRGLIEQYQCSISDVAKTLSGFKRKVSE